LTSVNYFKEGEADDRSIQAAGDLRAREHEGERDERRERERAYPFVIGEGE
jgi:hypothetical protein